MDERRQTWRERREHRVREGRGERALPGVPGRRTSGARGAMEAARREALGGARRPTVLPFPNFFPEPWLTSLRLTTTRPARQRWAAAESRSFERCVPTTSCRDRAPASSIPLRAHGPPAACICTSATAMRTRCGEGDLVGGWHAGASPFTPITRWVTNRGSSSASFAHTYTPLGRSQRL